MSDIINKYKKKAETKDRRYQNMEDINYLHRYHYDNLQNGCEKFVDELKNINSFDISTSFIYPNDISEVINKDKTYYYTGCSAFKKFINDFNKQCDIKIIHDNNLFVNKIYVDKYELENNKVIYQITYESLIGSDKTITPNEKNTFFG